MLWIFDDDDIFKFVIGFQINKLISNAEIRFFSSLDKGLEALEHESALPDILLVDVNFPDQTGWDYLEKYKNIIDQKRPTMRLYMVSSSISKIDKDQIEKFPYISGMLEKPIKDQDIIRIFK